MGSHPTPNGREHFAGVRRDGAAEVERLTESFQIRRAVTEMSWVARD